MCINLRCSYTPWSKGPYSEDEVWGLQSWLCETRFAVRLISRLNQLRVAAPDGRVSVVLHIVCVICVVVCGNYVNKYRLVGLIHCPGDGGMGWLYISWVVDGPQGEWTNNRYPVVCRRWYG